MNDLRGIKFKVPERTSRDYIRQASIITHKIRTMIEEMKKAYAESEENGDAIRDKILLYIDDINYDTEKQ